MLHAPLEYFQTLSLIFKEMFPFDFSIISFLLINSLALLSFLSFIYYNSSNKNYLQETSYFFILLLILNVSCIYYHYQITRFINMCNFQNFYKIFQHEMFIYIITLGVLGTIIGWSFIFSVIKQPSNLKKRLANEYIVFLVSILNHGVVPDRFLFFNATLGAFLGRKLVLFASIKYPISLFVILFFPILFCFFMFILLQGYFILSVLLPKTFGKYLISFFENNASNEMLLLVGLKKKKIKTKKNFSLKKKHNIKKRPKIKKRSYSTTSKLDDGHLEVYAKIKAGAMYYGSRISDGYTRNLIIQLAKVLDKAPDVNPEKGYEILDKCIQNPSLCKDYQQIYNNPSRNLASSEIGAIKRTYSARGSFAGIEGQVTYTTETPIYDNGLEKKPDFVDILEEKIDRTKNTVDKFCKSDIWRKTKDAGHILGVKGTIAALPIGFVLANVNAAVNSPSYPASLDNARRNFAKLEEIPSFDSDESMEDRLSKLVLKKRPTK